MLSQEFVKGAEKLDTEIEGALLLEHLSLLVICLESFPICYYYRSFV